MVANTDLTAAITPTFAVLDAIRNDQLIPFVRRLRVMLRQRHPLRSRLAEALLGRRLDRLGRPARKAETVGQDNEYRLIVLEPV